MEQGEIVAVQTKVGTGASTPTSGTLLRGTGVGTSAWGQVNLTSDVTGALPINKGGTGDATAAGARTNLGVNTALEVLALAYPIGSIYINANVSTNPATLLGFGTWVAWGIGKAIVGIDITQTEFDTPEETGGEKTHLLTTAEMPAHTHPYADTRNLIVYSGGANSSIDPSLGVSGTTTGSTGGGGAHNNLQPYQVGYVWKRTV